MSDPNGYLRSNIEFIVDELRLLDRADLAESMGTSVTSVGQLIRGESKGLKPGNLVRAAQRMGVTAEELVLIDMRSDPGLLKFLQNQQMMGIAEPRKNYNTSRIRSLCDRLFEASRTRILDTPGLEHIERTVDLLLPSKKH